MDYLAKEFCKYTGLKSDTLRYYVDQGLLHPTINEENHYRMYTEKDIIDYYYVRKCRDIQIPIKNIDDLLSGMSLSQQLEYLNNLKENLTEQLRLIELQIRGCDKMHLDIERIPTLMNEIIEKDSGPDICQLDLFGKDIEMNQEKERLIQEWVNANKLLFPIIKIKYEQLMNPSLYEYDVISSIGYVLIHETSQLPAYEVKSGLSVGMVVRLNSPFAMNRNQLEPLFSYIKEKNYEIHGDLTSWLITKSYEDGEDCYYYSLRIPVKK